MLFNGAQLHLLVNHLPVIGFPLLVILLISALVSRFIEVKRFVLLATVAIGLSCLLPFWTGEPAEEVIEKMPRVSEKLIKEHEELAEKAMVASVATALLAGVFFLWQRKTPKLINRFLNILIGFSLICSTLMALASHEGGKIRHPEISQTANE